MAVSPKELFFDKTQVIHFTPEAWNKDWAEAAHKISFNEIRPASMNRIDFALLTINPSNNKPGGFCTCRELDNETVYWQYGGSFPETIGTVWSARSYEALIEWSKQRYKRITTLVSNQNVVYLKLAMKYGFRIIGVRTFKNDIFVELLNELEEEK